MFCTLRSEDGADRRIMTEKYCGSEYSELYLKEFFTSQKLLEYSA